MSEFKCDRLKLKDGTNLYICKTDLNEKKQLICAVDTDDVDGKFETRTTEYSCSIDKAISPEESSSIDRVTGKAAFVKLVETIKASSPTNQVTSVEHDGKKAYRIHLGKPSKEALRAVALEIRDRIRGTTFQLLSEVYMPKLVAYFLNEGKQSHLPFTHKHIEKYGLDVPISKKIYRASYAEEPSFFLGCPGTVQEESFTIFIEPQNIKCQVVDK